MAVCAAPRKVVSGSNLHCLTCSSKNGNLHHSHANITQALAIDDEGGSRRSATATAAAAAVVVVAVAAAAAVVLAARGYGYRPMLARHCLGHNATLPVTALCPAWACDGGRGRWSSCDTSAGNQAENLMGLLRCLVEVADAMVPSSCALEHGTRDNMESG